MGIDWLIDRPSMMRTLLACTGLKLSIFLSTGEKLQNKKIQGIGDKVVMDGEAKKVGAGGIGGGVNLAVSNETIQERNQRMLKKFLKKPLKPF